MFKKFPKSANTLFLRNYALRFHEHHPVSPTTRFLYNIATPLVLVANVWAYWFSKKHEHARLEEEKINPPTYTKPFPRPMPKPFPWGDGQTTFFKAMRKYWGFEEN